MDDDRPLNSIEDRLKQRKISDILHELAHQINKLWWLIVCLEPSNEQLLHIMDNSETFRDQAWWQLVSQCPTKDELLWVVKNIKSHREKAGQQLIDPQNLIYKPTKEDLITLLAHEVYLDGSVWTILRSMRPTLAELNVIMDVCPCHNIQAHAFGMTIFLKECHEDDWEE